MIEYRPKPRLAKYVWACVLLIALATTGGRLRLSNPRSQTLRFAHTFTTASERAILDDVIAEFERRHPGFHVQQVVSNSEVYQTIGWRLQFRGRRHPDIFFQWQGYKTDYALEKGWALDLRPYLSKGFLHEFLESAVLTRDGGVYHLPQSIDISNLIWYNKDRFEEMGIQEPASLSEWMSICRQLSQRGLLALGQGNRDRWPMGNFGSELLGQSLGAEGLAGLFDPGHEVKFQELDGLSVFEELRESGCLHADGVLTKGSVDSLNDIEAKVLFLSGKSMQHAVGSWFLADVRDAAAKGELDFAAGVFGIPKRAGDRDALTSVTTGYVVSASTPYPEESAAFLRLLLSKPYQERFAELGGLSARKDVLMENESDLGLQLRRILENSEEMVAPPDTGYSPAQAHVFYEACAKLLTGELDLRSAANYWNEEKANLSAREL